ncbi:thiamine pyrophosphate-dependent enzyme [Mycobacterium sp. 050134]|uniref:thiamine pyrophosphate-dependent enzyme n=1 Tax=Mycobacterium sp. 050134 TaxID=3096111 RepID=UPI002ED9A537
MFVDEGLVQKGFGVRHPVTTKHATVAEALVDMLADLGVTSAFGICGGGIAPLWDALERGPLNLMHFRHEAGAAFAATEVYLASGSPVAVCVTSGPGISNALTGLLAARSDGAKVILVSGCTPPSQHNRTPMQETSPQTLGADMFAEGPIFHYGAVVESGSDLVEIRRKLAEGLQRKGSFVAHVSFSVATQKSPPDSASIDVPLLQMVDPRASSEDVRSCVDILRKERTAIWLGFGARHAAKEVAELVERIDAPVFCSPRAKGIFPESHPLFVGVTGFGGDRTVLEFMREHRPERVLVLGSRLGEMTSFWNPEMIPPRGLIHVDIDPTVPGASYPDIPTIAVHSEVGVFLTDLLTALGRTTLQEETKSRSWHLGFPAPVAPPPDHLCAGPVRPQILLEAMQRVVVNESSAIVLAEAGNAFAWATQRLRFNSPGRYRISTAFASMGHAGTGVLGSAYASGQKAVALVGDGTMLMNNEISTAVQYQIPAVWVILNDSGYGMIDNGMTQCGYKAGEISLPPTNFAEIARAMGAYGRRVEEESEVEDALLAAMTVAGPAVLDVRTDARCKAPIGGRVTSIVDQAST